MVKKSAPLIVGNWKAFIASPKDGLTLLKKVDAGLPRGLESTIVVCPPALIVAYLRTLYKGKRVRIGVQDVSFVDNGAHTGEVTAPLAKASGAEFVIVGHAERRAGGVTDEIVARETRAVLDAKLTPIVCIGEMERDRDGRHFSAIEKSLAASLKLVQSTDVQKVVIAYEPVWAIGATQAPDGRTVAESVLYIKKTLAQMYGRDVALKVKILYGGAVDQDSAGDLLREGHANGFLVGRASVDHQNFLGIICACQSFRSMKRPRS